MSFSGSFVFNALSASLRWQQQTDVLVEGRYLAIEQPNIETRLATQSDASVIASVLEAAFEEYKSLYTDQGFAATTPTSDQIQSRMVEGPIWVALLDQVVVGTASAVLRGEELYVRGMAVLPSSRGLHLGELLLKQTEDFALAHNCKRLILSTTPFLLRAIRLYERAGFKRTSEGPHELFGTPLFTMVRDLSPIA